MKTPLTFASRKEIDVTLTVLEGKVPDDIYGHLYFNSPAGTVNSETPIPERFPDGKVNSEYGEMIFNGDGMIFRFDLHATGSISVKSAMMKAPCFYADEATKYGTDYYNQGLYFKGMGLARTSMKMGSRNQLNTSLNAFKFPGDEHTRITANFDAGRPYELNPETISIKTPIGANSEWLGEFPEAMEYTFPLIQSTAHPSFDPVSQEFFTVNFLKSIGDLLFSNKRVFQDLAGEKDLVTRHVQELHAQLKGRFIKSSWFFKLLAKLFEFLQMAKGKKDIPPFDIDAVLKDLKEKAEGFLGMSNAVWLYRWTGQGPLDRWRVVDEEGDDLIIQQTMHQTNFSKDYIVLVDSSLKFAVDVMFSVPFPNEPWLDELVRWITAKTLLPETPLYIIKREDLKPGGGKVTAKKIIVPLETVHYSINYDNPQNLITIHTSHNTASCAAEWIRPYDKLAIDHKIPALKNTVGLMTSGEMDIGRIGKFIINGETGEVMDEKIIHSKGFDGDVVQNVQAHTWAVGLNTYRDIVSADNPVPVIRHNYWQSYGLDPRMLTRFIFKLYYNYRNRIIPAEKLLDYTKQQVPFCLFRQDTETMRIDEDYWVFKMNENFRSLQFIPRSRPDGAPANIDPQMDGYIFCTMINGENDIMNAPDAYSREIWIFDAASLKNGPICKLAHPDLQYSFTIHSIWVPDCINTQTTYNINVREDFNWVIAQFPDAEKQKNMKAFMDKNVYPFFP